MNWKKIVIEDLRDYPARKIAIKNSQEKLRALKYEQMAIKAIKTDPMPGGSNREEDKQTNIICQIENLKFSIAAANSVISHIEKGMSCLNQQEREAIEYFYINRPQNHIEKLMELWNVEQATVYRIKDHALRKLTLAMYGTIDV